MDYDALLKAISDATALRQLIDNKVADKLALESQITSNEKEIARLIGLRKATDDLVVKFGKAGEEEAGLYKELDKRMKKLKEAGVELPLQGDSPKGVVRP